VHPVYPANGDTVPEGTVVVDARIGADGNVASAVAREPVSEDLAQSAVAAVRQWRFTPTLLNCVPVEVGMSVSVRFGRR
jgi:TonB family protein